MTDKIYRHVKTGTYYKFLGFAQDSTTIKPLVVYTRIILGTDQFGAIWVRDADEFFDGRFDEVGMYA